jgi:hypothetical protein
MSMAAAYDDYGGSIATRTPAPSIQTRTQLTVQEITTRHSARRRHQLQPRHDLLTHGWYHIQAPNEIGPRYHRLLNCQYHPLHHVESDPDLMDSSLVNTTHCACVKPNINITDYSMVSADDSALPNDTEHHAYYNTNNVGSWYRDTTRFLGSSPIIGGKQEVPRV